MLKNSIPPFLKSGDTVAIVAPSGVVMPDAMQHAEEILQRWGLHVLIGNHIYDQHGMMAGHDEQRAFDFQQMLDNHHVRAIFCARGGYGMMRIIDRLNFSSFMQMPKCIIGFSDITVLHSCINRHCSVSSIHGLMPNSFATTDPQSLQYLHDILFESPKSQFVAQHPLNRFGDAQGQVVGGNLSMLYALRGTPYDIDYSNKILFIEDIGEKLYHIDRMIQNFRLSGILSNLAGLIVGQFTDMSEGSRPFGQTAQEIIASAVSAYSYPVCFDFQAGHTQLNLPLLFGAQSTLRVASNGAELSYLV